MANPNRLGGIIQLAVDGEIFDAKGEFSFSLGRPKRSAVIGADRVHGFMEEVQVPFIEGAVSDRGTLPLDRLLGIEQATVTLALANGKTIVLRDAWYAGEGKVATKDGEIECRFEGLSAEEIG